MNKKDRKLLNIKLGKIVRHHRKKNKVSQQVLCRQLEIQQSCLSKIENGSASLLANQLLFLSEFFKINFYKELSRVKDYERKY